MKLNEYQELAVRTIPQDKEKKLRVAEFCVGLCEEAGESAGVLKKVVFHDHPLTIGKQMKLLEELGDTLWHISALAHEYGITLERVAEYNQIKLKNRYPDGFSNERSVNRND
jgi:NTP pyrophosphatase (non-canonical NTP hydrolase)